MSLPTEKEYKERIQSYLSKNGFDFKKEQDETSNVIGDVTINEVDYQLSYEKDGYSPYLAIGCLFPIKNLNDDNVFNKALRLSNKLNDEYIFVKLVINKEYGIYAYTSMPLPLLVDLGSFVNYSSDIICEVMAKLYDEWK